MKKNILNNVIAPLIACFFFSTMGMAQKKPLLIGLRVPIQLELQKEDIPFPIIFEPKEQRSTVLNYGIDVLIEKEIYKKISAHIGAGYFRDKFNFKKFYNHELLNTGRDSIPIGTSTNNYIYNLIRFPIGLCYKIGSNKSIVYRIGGEAILNYSFKKTYNGAMPFPNANNTLSDFQYSGYSINIFGCFEIPISSCSLLGVDPYLRVYHKYKQDAVLYENSNQSITRIFDAFGLSIRYSLNLKK